MSRHSASPRSPRTSSAASWSAGLVAVVVILAGTYATSGTATGADPVTAATQAATPSLSEAAHRKDRRTPPGHVRKNRTSGTSLPSAPAPAPAPTPARAPGPGPAPAPVRVTQPPAPVVTEEAPMASTPAPRPSPGTPPATAPNATAPAGGAFPLLPPGSALPSGAECAARVQRDAWEPRPENAAANATRPRGAAPYGMTTWYTAAADSAAYRGRVDGDFTGTTDEIIQWASCKWGFPTDLNRAQAVAETTWRQSFVGDAGESFGLYQMRRGVWGGHPNSADSTAFNADWAMGLRRACYDGVMWYSELRADLDACIGVHYSGDPDESTWRVYTDSVRQHEHAKPWLQWSSAAGTPPTSTRGR